jgi:hypothetical protein
VRRQLSHERRYHGTKGILVIEAIAARLNCDQARGDGADLQGFSSGIRESNPSLELGKLAFYR